MRPHSLVEIARLTGGRVLCEDPSHCFTGIQTDSRSVEPGDLFWAIRGERADGHDFVYDAASRGALGAVVERPVDLPRDPERPDTGRFGLVLVPSTIQALRDLAAHYIRETRPEVIGVTGSVGKTSTKDMVGAVLSQRFTTYRNPGNLNSHIGLPLAVLSMDPGFQYAVLEMAMRKRGEIRELCEVAGPSIGILTDISMSHIGVLGSTTEIALAKSELLQCLPGNGLAVMCADNELIRKVSHRAKCRKVFYGFSEDAECRGVDVRPRGALGTDFAAIYRGERYEFTLNVPGAHQVQNALAAVALGFHLGLSPQEIACGLASVALSPMRLEILEIGDITVVNDAYNASPTSMRAALDLLDHLKGCRKVAILGDMLELGSFASKAHMEVGEYAQGKADLLFAVGDLARYIKKGWDQQAGHVATGTGPFSSWFPEKKEALVALGDAVRPGDVVLVKASRGMGFEDFAAFLKSLNKQG